MEYNAKKVQKALETADFISECQNVYRTSEYIVRQQLSFEFSENGNRLLLSEDTYYVRTKKRDKEYETFFGSRENVNGKRIRSSMFTRRYVE